MYITAIGKLNKTIPDMAGSRGIYKQMPISIENGTPIFSFLIFTLEPGGHTPLHNHPFEHLNYIIEGNGKVMAENMENDLKKGDFVMVVPGETHQFRNTSSSSPLVMIFALREEDGLSTEGIIILNNSFRVVYCNAKAKERCLLLSHKRLCRPSETGDNNIPIPTEILQDCLALKKPLLNNDRAIMPTSMQRLVYIDDQLKWLQIRSSIMYHPLTSTSPPYFLISLVYLSEIRKIAKEVLRVRFQLTRREAEITECVYRGLSNEEISKELYISQNTVETHLRNIFQKTGVRRRVNLANTIQVG